MTTGFVRRLYGRLQGATYVLPLSALVLLLAWNAAFTDRFLHIEWRDGRLYGALIDVVHRATPVLLLALGMTPVIGTGGIDLSVGSVMALAAALVGTGLGPAELSPWLIVPAALALGAAAGAFNGALVARTGIPPILATLAFLVAGRGLAQIWAGDAILAFDAPGFGSLATGELLGLPNTLFLSLGMLAIVAWLMRRTVFGAYVEALGDNPRAAALAGLPVSAVLLACYALSGTTAALAGALECADLEAADVHNTGVYLELDAILAVVMGGTALTGGRTSVLGSFLGAWVLQALATALLLRGVSPESALIVKALLVVAVCALRRPKGGSAA